MSVHQIKVQGVETSALGFGCGALGGRVSLRAGRKMLDLALDAGVTHFDVARSYGYGLAEPGMRRFLRRNRGQVTVATKAGIGPNLSPLAARTLGPVARQLRKSGGRGASGTQALAGQALGHIPLNAAELKASFTTSLQKLGTTDVDILFLHEPAIDQISNEVLTWLDVERTNGRAGRIGISTDQPPAPAHQLLPEWLIYQVAYRNLVDYIRFDLPVFGVHSIFRGHQGDGDPLAEAAGHGVMCLASMFSPGHLESNCKSISLRFKTPG